MMFKLRSIRLSFLKFLLASNDVFHQSLATAVHVKASLKCHLFVQDRKGTFSLCNHINVTAALSHSTN